MRLGPEPNKLIPATHILWIRKDGDRSVGYRILVHDIWWNLNSTQKLPTNPYWGTLLCTSEEGLIEMDFPVKDTKIALRTFSLLYGVQIWPKSLPEFEAVLQQAKDWGFEVRYLYMFIAGS